MGRSEGDGLVRSSAILRKKTFHLDLVYSQFPVMVFVRINCIVITSRLSWSVDIYYQLPFRNETPLQNAQLRKHVKLPKSSITPTVIWQYFCPYLIPPSIHKRHSHKFGLLHIIQYACRQIIASSCSSVL
jgi:hypothetical protein